MDSSTRFLTTVVLLVSGLIFTRAGSVYDLTVENHEGEGVHLQKYSGMVTLIVNVASLCGYTDSSYRSLTRLHDILSFGNRFSVLAFPCNQFGDQEPNEAPKIVAAMKAQYGAEFPIFNKIDVIGPDASPLFKTLIEQSSIVPDWNFYKYLVAGNGEVLNAWGTTTTIEEIFDEIEDAVEEAKKCGRSTKEDDSGQKSEEEGKDEL